MGRRRRGSTNDRDLDRLAFLERLSRPPASPNAAAAPGPERKPPAGAPVARYARFRQAAGVLFGLALLVPVWALAATVITLASMVRGECTVIAGSGRVVAWACAATVGYGIVKGLAEAILLWADVAELGNAAVEAWWRREEERPREPGP